MTTLKSAAKPAPYIPVMDRGPQDTAYTEMLRLLELSAQQAAEIERLRAELRKYTSRQMPACGSGGVSGCGCRFYSIEGGGSVVFKCIAHQTP